MCQWGLSRGGTPDTDTLPPSLLLLCFFSVIVRQNGAPDFYSMGFGVVIIPNGVWLLNLWSWCMRMGFISAALWQCTIRLMVLETAVHDSSGSSSSSNSEGRKSVGRLDREKDKSSDWGRKSIPMVTTWCFFFFFLFPVPTPIFTRLISSSFFLSLSSNVSVPCCYTISHLLMVFNWSQSFPLLHLIKRSS